MKLRWVVLVVLVLLLVGSGCISSLKSEADEEAQKSSPAAARASPETLIPKPTMPSRGSVLLSEVTSSPESSSSTTEIPAPTTSALTTTSPPETTEPPATTSSPALPSEALPVAGPESSNMTLIDVNDPSFTWTDECVLHNISWASGGSLLLCPDIDKPLTPGASVSVTFTGTAVSLMFQKCPDCGITNVSVDGVTYPELDMYSGTHVSNKTVIAEGLSNTQHILTIIGLDRSNPSSVHPDTAGTLIIDAVEVTVS